MIKRSWKNTNYIHLTSFDILRIFSNFFPRQSCRLLSEAGGRPIGIFPLKLKVNWLFILEISRNPRGPWLPCYLEIARTCQHFDWFLPLIFEVYALKFFLDSFCINSQQSFFTLWALNCFEVFKLSMYKYFHTVFESRLNRQYRHFCFSFKAADVGESQCFQFK